MFFAPVNSILVCFNMLNYIILPILISTNFGMVPLYQENNELAVRLRADLVFNGPVSETRSVWSGFMRLRLQESKSVVVTEEASGMMSQLTFLGAHDADVLSTRSISPLIYPTRSGMGGNMLGLNPASDIYTAFPRGFMLYPGRSSTEFPDDTKVSMILDQSILEDRRLCSQGSFFNVTREQDVIYVKTQIIPGGSTVHENLGVPTEEFVINFVSRVTRTDASMRDADIIPFIAGTQLAGHLLPRSSSTHLPEYLEDCDLVNGNYPSIHFRIMESLRSGGTHKGTIVYSPADYLESLGDGRCRLRVRNYPSRPLLGINFLTKVAVHFKADEIGFCDPA